MPKPELKTYAVSVPITVHVTYYVKAESVEEACAVDVSIDDLVFVPAEALTLIAVSVLGGAS